MWVRVQPPSSVLQQEKKQAGSHSVIPALGKAKAEGVQVQTQPGKLVRP